MAITQQTCQSCEKPIPMGIGVCPYCKKAVPSQRAINRQVFHGLLFMAGLILLMLIHRTIFFGW